MIVVRGPAALDFSEHAAALVKCKVEIRACSRSEALLSGEHDFFTESEFITQQFSEVRLQNLALSIEDVKGGNGFRGQLDVVEEALSEPINLSDFRLFGMSQGGLDQAGMPHNV